MAAADRAGQGDPQDNRLPRALRRPDLDGAAAQNGDFIGVDIDARQDQKRQRAAADVGVDLQRGLGDNRLGEVERDVGRIPGRRLRSLPSLVAFGQHGDDQLP